MTNSARLSGRPSSSAAYNVGDVVDTPDSAIKSWRYLGAGEWEPNDAVRHTMGPGGVVRIPGVPASGYGLRGPAYASQLAAQLTGEMRVRRSAGPALWPFLLTAAMARRDGLWLVQQLGRESADTLIRHYDAYIGRRETSEGWGATSDPLDLLNVPAPTAGWSNTTGNNPYTTTVNTQLTFEFVGTGLDLRLYCNNQGGAWEISVDGVVWGQISAWESVGNPYTRVGPRGLSNGAHTVVMRFVGGDGVNAPSGGTARGWISRAQQAEPTPAELIDRAMVRIYRPLENYAVVQQLSSQTTVQESAYQLRRNGTSDEYQWWPNHGVNGSSVIESQQTWIDGVLSPMTEYDAAWRDATRVDVVQRMTGRRPGTPADHLARAWWYQSMSPAVGYEIRTRVEWLLETQVQRAYPCMLGGVADFARANAAAADTNLSAHDDSSVTLPISDSIVIYPGNEWAWAVDLRDAAESVYRLGATNADAVPLSVKLQPGTNVKVYPRAVADGGVIAVGTVFDFSARYCGGRRI